MTDLTLERLTEAMSPGGASCLTSVTELEPAGGAHASVAPAKFATPDRGGDKRGVFAYERRYLDGEIRQGLLWASMLPGAPPQPQLREWEQVSTSRDFSALVPLASAELGDRHGSLLGLNISHGAQVAPSGVVLHDLAGASGRDVSGSLGVVGELGALAPRRTPSSRR